MWLLMQWKHSARLVLNLVFNKASLFTDDVKV